MKDSEIGGQTMKEGAVVPEGMVEPGPVINVNPHFSVQELPPVANDSRGGKGSEYRITCRDGYVDIKLRSTGERLRVFLRP